MSFYDFLQEYRIHPPKRKVITEKLLGKENAISSEVFVPGGAVWMVRHGDYLIKHCPYVARVDGHVVFKVGTENFHLPYKGAIENILEHKDVFHNGISLYTSEAEALRAVVTVHLPKLIRERENRSRQPNLMDKRRVSNRRIAVELKSKLKRLKKLLT
jgi:hypothetical protein